MTELSSPQSNPNVVTGTTQSPLSIALRHRHLLGALVVREIKDANIRSVMGSFWAVGAPLLTMLVYVFCFTFIFRTRLGINEGPEVYVGYVLTGLAVWISLQEVANRAPNAIIANANLVKQIVFPTELLPLKMALAAQTTLIVTVTVATIACAFANRLGWASLVLLPLAIALFVLMSIGISYFLAALAVFFPDVRNIIQLLFSIGLFLHPVLYPPGSAPPFVARMFEFSPFSHLIWCFRDALYLGTMTRPFSWAVCAVTAILVYLLGYRFFRMLKPTFGNAL